MQRLLIVGFGDIARRAAPQLARRFALVRLSRADGFDLDRPESLVLPPAEALLHCAPPPAEGDADGRTARLIEALEKARILPARVVYVSTSGVYGDCGGQLVDEERTPVPRSARARRRLDAERRLALWCGAHDIALIILRAPGIYAAGRLPLERLLAGMPALRPDEDVYTSHIHADDLAAIAVRALQDDAPPGIYNAADDSQLKMGDWLDLVADVHGLARPARVSRSEAERRLPEKILSFMRESRRLDNRKLKRVLGFALRYPTVHHGLGHEHFAGIDQPA